MSFYDLNENPETSPLKVNPFSDEYWQGELAALKLRQERYEVKPVRVDWFKIQGRCDDYLNCNFRHHDTWLPRLLINDEVWMSITPMEIQSSALALHRARGHVATTGLGLGYFAIRAAQKPNVTKVTVFEMESSVIDWFYYAYEGRPELDKISVVKGDARETFTDMECDFVFSDIYQTMLPDEVLTDTKHFRKKNKIKRYHFWGMEKVVLELIDGKLLSHPMVVLGSDLASYFRHWMRTPMGVTDGTMLADLHRNELERSFLLKARRVLRDFPI